MSRYDDVNNAQKKDNREDTEWIEKIKKEQQNTDPPKSNNEGPQK